MTKIIEHSPFAKFKNFNGEFRATHAPIRSFKATHEVKEATPVMEPVKYSEAEYEAIIEKMLQNEKVAAATIEALTLKLREANDSKEKLIAEANAFRVLMLTVNPEGSSEYLAAHAVSHDSLSIDKVMQLLEAQRKVLQFYSEYIATHRKREIKVENIVKTTETIAKKEVVKNKEVVDSRNEMNRKMFKEYFMLLKSQMKIFNVNEDAAIKILKGMSVELPKGYYKADGTREGH